MKKIFFFFFLFIAISLTACTKKEVSITPEVVGFIYDNSTKKPLDLKTGLIGFNGLTPDDFPPVTLNKDGSFTLQPVVVKYQFFKPNLQKYTQVPASVYISFNGFKVKLIDLSDEKFHRIKADDKDEFRYYKNINLGIIYLDKESKNMNTEYPPKF